MLKYNKLVVTENKLLCRMVFNKCRNIIRSEHGNYVEDDYTGKLLGTLKDEIELCYKKSFDMIYRYDHDDKCFQASLMGFAIK